MFHTIGILIPLYNGIEFLEECLQSVSAQTYHEWEAWIGINGHGDDGGAIAQKVKELASYDSRIHVIIQDSSISGKVQSLNHLMTIVSPSIEWIAILDCDDKWTPIKLEKD
jgi:glycosyltransferase involved in cell wall biosynthesis